MGRPERLIDPQEGPLAQFAWDLRELRRIAGSPSYRSLASRANYSATALSVAASGTTLPSLEVTLAFVRTCGGDIEDWTRRWQDTSELIAGATPPRPADPAGRSPWALLPLRWRDGALPAERLLAWQRRQPRRMVALAVAGLVALVLIAPVVAGWTGTRRASAKPTASPAGTTTASAIPPGFDFQSELVVGFHCPMPNNGTVEYGDGWTLRPDGGWLRNGCNGSFRSTAGTTPFTWILQPGGENRDCLVSIYVPADPAAGGTAQYVFYDPENPQVPLRHFSIDQSGYHGEWFSGGRYILPVGVLRVQVTKEFSQKPYSVAASAIHMSCLAS